MNHDEIKDIKIIDIYVRNPYDRFVTGVNSFLDYNQNLDQTTLLYFITNYLFLNRHFCPQFYWLVNLQRFTKAKIKINSIDLLSKTTNLTHNKNTNQLSDQITCNDKIYFYLSIDKVLTEDLIGQTVTFKKIIKTIQYRYPEVYKEVVQRSIDLCNVLV